MIKQPRAIGTAAVYCFCKDSDEPFSMDTVMSDVGTKKNEFLKSCNELLSSSFLMRRMDFVLTGFGTCRIQTFTNGWNLDFRND